jgi:Na+/H+-dicarboxylate symporter
MLFLAQAKNTHLVLGQMLGILIFAMIASRCASGVVGGDRQVHERLDGVKKRS